MRLDHYNWSGGREAMLRFGPSTGPVVVVALPLFEEANRTRAFAVTICRALAKRGVASVLPDLPGQGESLVPTADIKLSDLRAAFASAAGVGAYSFAIRSGALIDTDAKLAGRWHLAQQPGQDLLSELDRLRKIGKRTDFGGNAISDSFLKEISTLSHSDLADAMMTSRPITPLWRRADPDNDPALAALLADDIADWIATCEG